MVGKNKETEAVPKEGFFKRLRARLNRGDSWLTYDLVKLAPGGKIDEAFLDLRGTEKLHEATPARTLARLALRIEQELDLTVSIGLSYNKFLAKISSDLDKPRGYAVIGRAEARDFLADRPVGIIWGRLVVASRSFCRADSSRRLSPTSCRTACCANLTT